MRTEKELFELMLKHQGLFETGACLWLVRLYRSNIITYDEMWLLNYYLDENKPENASFYWWKIGKIQPRLDWINEQIEKL